MQKGVSVVICTYNGRARLADTLSHLAIQKTTAPVEIVLVDNNSSDDTKNFADNWWQKNSTSSIEFRSFNQPIPGKSYAQELGFEQAHYEYLLICDDDNWLSETYVQKAYEVMESDSQIGALGGWCEAVFEKEKPQWFEKYAHIFAVSKQGIQSGDITYKKGCVYGAGMVLRKSHWQSIESLGFSNLLTCRRGKSLKCGEDTEYCLVLRLMGYKIWFDENLYFQHWMPESRMSLSYIQKIRKAMSESNFVVSVYSDELKNRKVTQRVFYKRAYIAIKKDFTKQLIKRIAGSFEEKEISKEYFRTLFRHLFFYSNYSENRQSIKKWLTNNR